MKTTKKTMSPLDFPSKRQSGFSLIELMVGLTIGLLVALAAAGSLVFTSTTQRTISDATGMQQQASIVMRMIGGMLRQAGGIELDAPNGGKVAFSNAYNGFNGGINGLSLDINGQDGAADTLMISTTDPLDATTGISISINRTCTGSITSFPGVRIDNQISLIAGELRCGEPGAQAQALADGVEDFQVTYGVVTNGELANQSIQYFTASQNPIWNQVHAVQVCLRMSTASTGNAGVNVGAVTGCNGEQVAAGGDGRIRKVFRNTFFIRNYRA